MREKVKDRGRLSHMLEMAQSLDRARQRHTIDEVKNDKILFYGLSKMIEIIGEAAYKITSDYKDSHDRLPWQQIVGMRHILVHGYYAISPELLWEVITDEIPGMVVILSEYLDEFID